MAEIGGNYFMSPEKDTLKETDILLEPCVIIRLSGGK